MYIVVDKHTHTHTHPSHTHIHTALYLTCPQDDPVLVFWHTRGPHTGRDTIKLRQFIWHSLTLDRDGHRTQQLIHTKKILVI